MPVSYIFRLFSGEYNHPANKSGGMNGNLNINLNSTRKDQQIGHKSKVMRTLSPAPSICSTTPTGSEMDEENYESESEKSSIDSWSNNSIENDTNTILKMINPTPVINNEDNEKPYICQFNNCKKRYRNSNGLKYHTKSVHTNCIMKKEPAIPKMYKCHCDKVYKTPYGLKNHAKTCSASLANAMQMGKVLDSKLNINNANGKDAALVTSFANVKTLASSASSISINHSPSLNIQTSVAFPNDSMINGSSAGSPNSDFENKTPVKKEPNCPSIKAPTLQQHLLSPLEAKTSFKASQ